METEKTQKTKKIKKTYENGLFIFHNDLRIIDNTGLNETSELCKNLYVCFIFTPEQVGKSNAYRSNNAIQYMIESLEDLSKEIQSSGGKLMIFYGKQKTVIDKLIHELHIDIVGFNRFYTPYAIHRDNETVELCQKRGIDCKMFSDFYLQEPGTILSGSGTVYKKFTPFYEECLKYPVKKIWKKTIKNWGKYTGSLSNVLLSDTKNRFVKINENILVHGGRTIALQQMKKSVISQKNYANTRDFLAKPTTQLSAAVKFGCVSIREMYHDFHSNHELIRQLYWRDFFAHLLYAYPETMTESYYFKKNAWSHNSSHFEKWCEGKTGVPVVDACMRQLNQTGYMHNRGRMIVANFLVKTLLIDWRHGAKYFAQHLTDYDIASNQGNWQNVSSTGVYYTPYFRDMNPWIQSKKLDKDAEFIKQWLPELKDVDPKDIHQWDTAYSKYTVKYPQPIVDYREQKEKMMKLYK